MQCLQGGTEISALKTALKMEVPSLSLSRFLFTSTSLIFIELLHMKTEVLRATFLKILN